MLAASPNDPETMLTQRDVPHRPVLLPETLELLRPAPGSTVVDATLGPGGHAEALLELIGPMGHVIGIDRDQAAIAFAGARLQRFGERLVALQGDHRDIVSLLHDRGIAAVDAVFADLGVSSQQLD